VILYLDTSALVKLYFSEPGSEIVRRAVLASSRNATSIVTYVKTASALSRKLRMRELSERAFRRHRSEFQRDWEYLTKLACDAAVCVRGAELVDHFPLKAYDAIHRSYERGHIEASNNAYCWICFI
jgi:uncharacterized protein